MNVVVINIKVGLNVILPCYFEGVDSSLVVSREITIDPLEDISVI